MEKEYCRNDKGPHTIEVNPAGGTLQIDGKDVDPAKFIPSAFKVGSHAVTYTVNGKIVTTSFAIVAPPSVELTHKTGVGEKFIVVFSINTNARDGSSYTIDYGDGSSAKTTDPSDPTFAKHKYTVNDERKFNVMLVVTDGPCTGNAKDTVKFG
jgi:hypothetical protein